MDRGAWWATGTKVTESRAQLSSLAQDHPRPEGFPGAASDKESTCQCRRHVRFSSIPGLGRFPQRRKWQPTPKPPALGVQSFSHQTTRKSLKFLISFPHLHGGISTLLYRYKHDSSVLWPMRPGAECPLQGSFLFSESKGWVTS